MDLPKLDGMTPVAMHNDWLLLEVLNVKKTAGGIILPTSTKFKTLMGKLVSMGPAAYTGTASEVKGDPIMTGKPEIVDRPLKLGGVYIASDEASFTFPLEGKDYAAVRLPNILGEIVERDLTAALSAL